MSLFIFLTVVQALIAAALVGVILMQQSEGGGLGMGGSPSGLMSARGAADFLTRATGVLATLFVILSITLAGLAVGATSGRKIDTSLNRTVPPANPLSTDPLAGAAPAAPDSPAAPAPASADPLAGAAAAPAPAPVAKATPSARTAARPAARAAEPKPVKVTEPAPKASAAAPAPIVTLPAPAAT